MTHSRDSEKFLTQATGQGPAEISAEAEDKFFALVVDAQIRFEKGTDGKMKQLAMSE